MQQRNTGPGQVSKALDSKNADLCQPPLSYPIAELSGETGIPRTAIYEEIRRGNLRTFKVGRKRFATYESVRDWIRCLEEQTRRGAA